MLIQHSIFKSIPKKTPNHFHITNNLTLCELADLSLAVYNTSLPPYGWQRFAYKEYWESQTVIALYVKETTDKPIFVTAFRGTTLNVQNLLANLTVLQGYYPKPMLNSANDFYWEIIPQLVKKYGRIGTDQMYNTGHSLGAVVSDLYGLKTGTFNSITFDNPGTKPLLVKLMQELEVSQEDMLRELESMSVCYATYLGGVNLINTCNEQTGSSYRLVNLPFDHYAFYGGASLPIPDHPLKNFHYMAYSLDQHKIENMIHYLHAGNLVLPISSPIGFASGYIDYLDASHKEYWDSYALMVWKNNISIREDFKNQYEVYLKDFYQKLQLTQSKVLGKNNSEQSNTNLHLVLRFKNS